MELNCCTKDTFYVIFMCNYAENVTMERVNFTNISISLPGVAFTRGTRGVFFSSYLTPVLFPLALPEGKLPNETFDIVDSSVIGASIPTDNGEEITQLPEPVMISLTSFRIQEYPRVMGVQVSHTTSETGFMFYISNKTIVLQRVSDSVSYIFGSY